MLTLLVERFGLRCTETHFELGLQGNIEWCLLGMEG